MRSCTEPSGHRWRPTSFTIRAGSTPVECEFCGETGYHIDNKVVDPNEGQPGEELF